MKGCLLLQANLQQKRPELKAPRYMVVKHHPEAIADGYWFVTPYTRLGLPPSTEQKDYIPCMNGAHIYDGDGNLVWSGACKYDNRIIFNFRPVHVNGTDLLTFYLPGEEHGFNLSPADRMPTGVLMDDHYEEVSRIGAKGYLMDGHEFNFMPDGRSVLLTTLKGLDTDASMIGQKTRKVMNTGFQEIELNTGDLRFDWDPISHGILLNESCDTTGMANHGKDSGSWDFFHINAADKFANGDYLISARHMSTLYRVSKVDGHVIWRLGGCHNTSDFLLEEGLPFFWQHHSRIRFENATHIILSVFDNASEDKDRGEPFGQNPPVGKIIILDTASTPMTAKMLRRFDRPDYGQTAALGSVSLLGDKPPETANVFIDWAFEGYISEYDYKDGLNRLIMEARFVSDRKRSYRAYKFPFKAAPTEPPVLAILPLGIGQDKIATAFYVSWNGATEVRSWAFYSGDSPNVAPMRKLATVKKRGFETQWVIPTLVRYAYAVALDADGHTLGESVVTSITPAASDEKYTLPYPALQGMSLDRTPADRLVPPVHNKHKSAGEDSSVAQEKEAAKPLLPPPTLQLSEAQHAGMLAPDAAKEQVLPSLSERALAVANFATLVVDAFALLGLCLTVRGLLQRFHYRHRLASLASVSSETPLLTED